MLGQHSTCGYCSLCCLPPLPGSPDRFTENPFLSAGAQPSPAGCSELPLAQPGQGSQQPWAAGNANRKMLRWLETSFPGGALPALGSAAAHVLHGVCQSCSWPVPCSDPFSVPCFVSRPDMLCVHAQIHALFHTVCPQSCS